MPRHIAGAVESESFRAVITTTRRRLGGQPDLVFTEYVGPYSKAGTAKARITAARAATARLNARTARLVPQMQEVEGHVERSTITWEPLA